MLLTAVVAVAVTLGPTACGGGDAAPRADSGPRPTTTAAPPATTAAPAPTTSPDGTAVATGFPEDWTPPTLRWRDCDLGVDARCATLTVPLDWGDPAGPTVDLALGRLPATGDRIGSLIANPGGPGGSGLEFLSYEPFSTAVSRRFDIVSWDPRGVGDSTAVTCGDSTVSDFLDDDPDPDDAGEQATLDADAAAVSEECRADDLDLLAHVGTRDVARDLEAIRRALGDEPLTYVGFSYGTQIGQQYAEFFPTRIRAMVLDGVVDPALGYTEFLLGQTAAFEQAFRANSAACRDAGPDECGVEDLPAAYDQVRERVERTRLPADGPDVGPAELAVAAVYTSYSADGWLDLGPALQQAIEDDDGQALSDLAQGYYDFGGFTAYAAVVCIDTPPPAGADAYRAFADEARRVSPRFGGQVANELLPCATWPVPPVAAPSAITAPGAPPILVVGNTGDPATPYDNAVAVADQLSSGVLVTADIDGHTAYGIDRCVTRVVDRYLIDLTVPPADPRCG